MQCEGAEGGGPGPWSVLGVLALPCPRASQTAVLGPRGRREGAGAPDSGSSACATHSQLWRVSLHRWRGQQTVAKPLRDESLWTRLPVGPALTARFCTRHGPIPTQPGEVALTRSPPCRWGEGGGPDPEPGQAPGASLRHEACLTPNGHRTLSCHLGPRAWPAPGTEWGSWWTGVEPQ